MQHDPRLHLQSCRRFLPRHFPAGLDWGAHMITDRIIGRFAASVLLAILLLWIAQ
jgi:hypothetical protein